MYIYIYVITLHCHKSIQVKETILKYIGTTVPAKLSNAMQSLECNCLVFQKFAIYYDERQTEWQCKPLRLNNN